MISGLRVMIDIIPGVSFLFHLGCIAFMFIQFALGRPAVLFFCVSLFFKVLMWVRMIRSHCTVCRVAAALTTACATVHAHILHPTEVWS